jgi:hypothetical protein
MFGGMADRSPMAVALINTDLLSCYNYPDGYARFAEKASRYLPYSTQRLASAKVQQTHIFAERHRNN